PRSGPPECRRRAQPSSRPSGRAGGRCFCPVPCIAPYASVHRDGCESHGARFNGSAAPARRRDRGGSLPPAARLPVSRERPLAPWASKPPSRSSLTLSWPRDSWTADDELRLVLMLGRRHRLLAIDGAP